MTTESPEVPVDTSDASIMALRIATEELFEDLFAPSGATVDGKQVFQFGVVLVTLVPVGFSVALAWRRGIAPLGVRNGQLLSV